MGSITVTEFVSLDGVMEAPGGEPGYRHTGWVGRFPDWGQFEYKFDEVMEHDALLIGRKTYETFAGSWPQRSGEFADRMNGMPKFVVSTTLEQADWNNSTLIKQDVIPAIATLKEEYEGKLLVAGSHTLVASLKEHDLVDEYRLMVFPLVLGSGMRLFENAEETTTLRLTDLKQYGEGILVLAYEVVRQGDSR